VVNNFYDDDGDYILDTSKFSHDTPTYRWLDRNGTVIPASSYSQTIGGCSTSLNAPLTLEISSTVSVSSQYGLPNTSEPVSILKRYQIYAPAQICYLRPNSLEWVGSDTGWESGSSVPDLTSRGGGFNSKTFSKSNGFYLSSQFPTTGFVGAQFKLTMDRNVQTDYTYSIVSGSGISIDSNGLVSFTSKPTSAVTLMATDKNVSTRTISYTFTIKNWVVPKASRGTYAQQLKLCGNNSANIPAVTLLTNSPQNKLPASIVTNYYYRDVGTVFSEWGQTIKQKYSKSDWQAEWSNVPYYLPKTTSKYRYAVSSLSGAVMFTDLNNTTGYIVCKG